MYFILFVPHQNHLDRLEPSTGIMLHLIHPRMYVLKRLSSRQIKHKYDPVCVPIIFSDKGISELLHTSSVPHLELCVGSVCVCVCVCFKNGTIKTLVVGVKGT